MCQAFQLPSSIANNILTLQGCSSLRLIPKLKTLVPSRLPVDYFLVLQQDVFVETKMLAVIKTHSDFKSQ